jgi:hypothetical protein
LYIACDCGRSIIGETSSPLEVCIKEYKYSLAQGLPEKPELAQYAYEEDNMNFAPLYFAKEQRSCKLK